MKKYIVTLTDDERQQLYDLITRGKAAAQKLTHARILLKADAAEGRADWTLRLLADKLVELEIVEAVSHETVRQVLKKTNSSRG